MTTEYFDDYETCDHTDAILRFAGDDLDPDELSRVFAVHPSHSHRKDEPHLGLHGRVYAPWRTGIWYVSSEDSVQSLDLRRHVDWALDLLNDKADWLAGARERGIEADVHCYWVGEATSGPVISPDQMRRLAALDLDLSIDWDDWQDGPRDLGERMTAMLARELGSEHPALAAGLGEALAELYGVSERTAHTIEYMLHWDLGDRTRSPVDDDVTMEQFDELYDDWGGRLPGVISRLERMRADDAYPHDDAAIARLHEWREAGRRERDSATDSD